MSEKDEGVKPEEGALDGAVNGALSMFKIGCAALVLLVAAFIGLVIWYAIAPISDEKAAERIGTACYSSVREKLADPGTISDDGVVKQGDNSWKVTGTGTAGNQLGGQVPFTWECTGYLDQDDKAQVTSRIDQ